MLRTRALSLIVAAITAGVLIAPAATASATTAQPTCYARGAARCLVVTQNTPPGLKYGPQAQPGNEWNPHGG